MSDGMSDSNGPDWFARGGISRSDKPDPAPAPQVFGDEQVLAEQYGIGVAAPQQAVPEGCTGPHADYCPVHPRFMPGAPQLSAREWLETEGRAFDRTDYTCGSAHREWDMVGMLKAYAAHVSAQRVEALTRDRDHIAGQLANALRQGFEMNEKLISREAEVARLRRQLGDAAMLLKIMVARAESPREKCSAAKALEWLRQNGLEGSLLRDTTPPSGQALPEKEKL